MAMFEDKSLGMMTGSPRPILFTPGPNRPEGFYFVKYFLIAVLALAMVAQIVLGVIGFKMIDFYDNHSADIEETHEAHTKETILVTTLIIGGVFKVVGLIGIIKESFIMSLGFAICMTCLGVLNCFGGLGVLTTINVAFVCFIAGLAYGYAYQLHKARAVYRVIA